MKKRYLLPILIGLLLMIPVPVLADLLYANGDQVPAFEDQDINSDILRWFYGGETVLVETYSGPWVGVLAEDPSGDGQTIAWVPMSSLSSTMPPQYCSHQWNDWVVYTQPTCTSTGMRMRSCQICGTSETQQIAMTAHTFGPWTVTRQATCVSQGEVMHRCMVCGYEEKSVIEKTGHTFGDWTMTKQATCTAEGERYRRCYICGQEEHQVIEKLPHSFGDWVVTKDPTCTEEGIRMHKCQVCGFEATEPVEMLPHDFEWQILVEATDHSAGIRTNVCKNCGFTEEQVSYDPEGTLRRGDRGEEVREVQQLLADMNYLSAGGADGIFGAGTEKAITEFQNDQGLTPDGVAWPQTIQKLHHDFNPWVTIVRMTRNTPGERERSCKDCNYVQHETVEPQPSFVKGDRGEGVRTMQKLLTAMGHDAGSFDGIYGSMLDAAFEGFAKDHDFSFEAGKILPSQVDSMINAWISTVPKQQWMGDGGLGSRVNLALTITSVAGDDELLESADPNELEAPAEENAEEAEADAEAPAEENVVAEEKADAEAPAEENAGTEEKADAEAPAEEEAGTAEEDADALTEENAEVLEEEETLTEENTGTEEDADTLVEEPAGEKTETTVKDDVMALLEENTEAAGESVEEDAEAAGESVKEDAAVSAETPEEASGAAGGESSDGAEGPDVLSEEMADEPPANIITYNWTLTNLGDEDCTFVALLLNFGDDQDFHEDNLVMVIDGTVLKANCGNDVSGTFSVSSDWGEGALNFTALAISEGTGEEWISNVDMIELA